MTRFSYHSIDDNKVITEQPLGLSKAINEDFHTTHEALAENIRFEITKDDPIRAQFGIDQSVEQDGLDFQRDDDVFLNFLILENDNVLDSIRFGDVLQQ
ncbi:hypothetical protein Pyn_05952 [Prunus yedoensis var. nudiflora]|uniref:Uncharacterized protein n=1 Tax=Prunus yedoensis var. nudiflora TaxID=2094558 RepID=A0A314XRR9_PRUYE|nr:hypothetical protein Pyn_05952 [Prunus yedoensis var. nudiflora]